jgi:hypothetical protein
VVKLIIPDGNVSELVPDLPAISVQKRILTLPTASLQAKTVSFLSEIVPVCVEFKSHPSMLHCSLAQTRRAMLMASQAVKSVQALERASFGTIFTAYIGNHVIQKMTLSET